MVEEDEKEIINEPEIGILRKIFNYIYNIFKEYKIISFIIGVLFGYTLSRPREYLLHEIIITKEYQMRKKEDSLINLTEKIQKEVETNRQYSYENNQLGME
jgi:hypothetical protein